MISRLEQAKLDIIAEFAAITTANGFRNNVIQAIGAARPSSIIPPTGFPEVGVVVPKINFNSGGDGSSRSFDEVATVFVIGKFEAQTATDYDSAEFQLAQESLINDFATVWATISTKYISDTDGRWCIVSANSKIIVSADLGEKPNRGNVEMSFQIALNGQGQDFI